MRPHRFIAAAGAAAAALVLSAGCSASRGVAAEVAGVEYAADDLWAYLATTDGQTEARAAREDAAAWLSDWVFFTAVELELKERGTEVTGDHEFRAVADITGSDPSFVPGAAGGGIVVRQRAVVLAVLEWVEGEVPDALVAEPLRHLCSRHILVASQSEADEVLARIDAGEEFGLLAAELSQDPGSGPLGGDLGCVVEGAFVVPFEEAAYAAEPGEAVVAETSFGFHVIEVISSGLPTAQNHPQLDAQTLARMAEDAESASLERAQGAVQAQREQLLLELQAGVVERYGPQVRIDDRYGRWDPDQFRVVLASDG